MEFERKIYREFEEWKKNSDGKSALFVAGARRVGKTYAVRKFAERAYKSSIFIDFYSASREVLALFDDVSDLDMFYKKLSATFGGVKLYERESLIVFDEIQLFPRARQLLKVFVEDGRYDFVETGSLVTVMMNPERILIPSEEEKVEMHPMDFEEFLWAKGDTTTFAYLRDCFENLRPVGASVHQRLMREFREYVLVGGMPQALEAYLENKDFRKADRAKRRILDLYRNDVGKFAGRNAGKVRAIFDSLPAMLSAREKSFVLSALKKDARRRNYEDAFLWLSDAMVINPCFNTTDVTPALSLNAEDAKVKCYMADTGLLITHAMNAGALSGRNLYDDLVLDRLNLNEGMFMENVVSQMLVSGGHKLFFHKFRDASVTTSQYEIDFLIVKDGKVSPVEVKSAKSVHHTSLDRFRAKYKKRAGQPYILCRRDIEVKDGIIYLPLYMAGLL